MIADAIRALWAEPRVPNPPARGKRDWLLIALLAPAAVLEGIFGDRPWPAVSVIVIVALLPTLLWRRTHPLAMVTLAFGSIAVVDIASIVADVDWEGVSAGAFVLLLLYALFRWGSGRDAMIGLAIALVPVLLGVVNDNPVGDVVGGAFILLFIAAVGASIRYQDNARRRGMDQVKLREREQLARELHDTVAHHVSAIAIQAQAGRTLAASRPEAALDALHVIEDEASRTLTEMRAMVGALRQGEEADLSPQRGVADIERLAANTGTSDDTDDTDDTGHTGVTGDRPRVDVELSGDLAHLWPAVDAALYRLAQESITNALRHARHATHIRVRVSGDDNSVRLTVTDDGDAGPAGASAAATSGYGLVGMTERAHLLGGRLEAGPNHDGGGWTVEAVLPRTPRSGVVP